MSVEITENGLWIGLGGERAYFNAYWLRDADPSNRDPQTNESRFDITLAPQPKISAAHVEGENLHVVWADEAQPSLVPLARLAHIAAHGRDADPADFPRHLWRAGHSDHFTRVAQADALGSGSGLARLTHALIADGVAVVTEMENSDDSLSQLINAIGPVTRTVDGEFFDVRVHVNPVNTAFTSGKLPLHTDLPNEEAAPGVQFLHCRENSAEGGMSVFMDGAAAAEEFREIDPEGFELLSTYSIGFRRLHDNWDYISRHRVIELDHKGAVSGLSVSQHLRSAIDLPQDLLDRYYPAFCRFSAWVNNERFINRFRMAAGECLIFDNHRILHGRDAYAAQSGARHLRGGYTDRAAMRSTYRRLIAKGYFAEQSAA